MSNITSFGELTKKAPKTLVPIKIEPFSGTGYTLSATHAAKPIGDKCSARPKEVTQQEDVVIDLTNEEPVALPCAAWQAPEEEFPSDRIFTVTPKKKTLDTTKAMINVDMERLYERNPKLAKALKPVDEISDKEMRLAAAYLQKLITSGRLRMVDEEDGIDWAAIDIGVRKVAPWREELVLFHAQ